MVNSKLRNIFKIKTGINLKKKKSVISLFLFFKYSKMKFYEVLNHEILLTAASIYIKCKLVLHSECLKLILC